MYCLLQLLNPYYLTAYKECNTIEIVPNIVTKDKLNEAVKQWWIWERNNKGDIIWQTIAWTKSQSLCLQGNFKFIIDMLGIARRDENILKMCQRSGDGDGSRKWSIVSKGTIIQLQDEWFWVPSIQHGDYN